MEFLVVMHLLMIVFLLQSFLSQCQPWAKFLASVKFGLVFLASVISETVLSSISM